MSLTFTSLTALEEATDVLRPDGQTGRSAQGRLGGACGARLHRFLAGWPRLAHLLEMEWTHVLLEAWPLWPLVHAGGSRSPRGFPRLASPSSLGPAIQR